MQIRFLGTSWIQGNANVINRIYSSIRPEMNDTWLETEGDGSYSKDEIERDILLAVHKYQTSTSPISKVSLILTTQTLKDLQNSELQVDGGLLREIVANRKMPTSFTENYQKWLSEEAFFSSQSTPELPHISY